jgi:hypothetical protein
MAKQLNEEAILNELHGESAFFKASLTPLREDTPQRVVSKDKKKPVQNKAGKQPSPSQIDADNPSQLVDQTVDQQANQETDRATVRTRGKSTNQPIKGSIDQPRSESVTRGFDMSPILPRPKAFYISEKQDENLDVLVKKLSDKLKGKVGQKIDRSVASRLVFEHIDLTSDETVEQLATLLIGRLTSQLTGQQEE